MTPNLTKYLGELIKRRIYFTFQSQSKSQFYNLAIRTKKKEYNLHGETLTHLEMELSIIWSDVVKEVTPNLMPLPPMPLPRMK